MIWRSPIRLCLALLLASAIVSLSAEPAAKKNHHAPAARSSTVGHKATTGTAARSRAHAHAHAYASIHISPERRAALVEEIDARLKVPPPQAFAEPSNLDGFYAQLASHELERRDSGMETGTVRVLQFGDSHTAADMFTGEARRIFQEQFGNGSIGYSYAGHPFAGYRIIGSQRSQTTGWKTQGNKFTQLGDGETGLGGISISTSRAGERVTLDAPCTTLELQYLEQPGGGSLRFTDNGLDTAEIQTSADTTGPGTYTYNCPAGDHHFEVTTEQMAPVTLLGWVATQPGVTWEALGINGAEAPLILKWDQSLFSRYLKDNSPALIVLAYGTNEAASPLWDEDSYRQTFASLIDTIHQYVPESSILVVGPADRSVAQRRVFHPFDGTERIIKAQRAVCRTHGCAFWDQQQRMGGLGAMQDWYYAGWAQPDHTHFTGPGYKALADALMADLMAGYEGYKARTGAGNDVQARIQAKGAVDGFARTNP